MPTSDWFRSLPEALASTRTASRLTGGGIGILIFLMLGSYGAVDGWFQPGTRRYVLAALACLGFSAGIGFYEFCRWIYLKRRTEGDFSEQASPPAAREQRTASPRPVPTASRPSARSIDTTSTGRRADGSRRTGGHTEGGTHSSSSLNHSSRSESDKTGERRRLRPNLVGGTAAVVLLVLLGIAGTFYAVRYLRMPVADATVERSRDEQLQAEKEEVIERAIEEKPEELKPALREYARTSKDVEQILSEGLEAKNIGGAIALAVTNWQFNKGKGVFKQPEELGLQRITSKEALVNLAIKGDVTIDSVEVTPQAGRKFKVKIKVFNNTSKLLPTSVSKGTVIEIKDGRLLARAPIADSYERVSHPQNFANAEEPSDKTETVIPPKDFDTLEFTAYCVNEGLARPNRVESANVTIYEVKNTRFGTPERLHAIMRETNPA